MRHLPPPTRDGSHADKDPRPAPGGGVREAAGAIVLTPDEVTHAVDEFASEAWPPSPERRATHEKSSPPVILELSAIQASVDALDVFDSEQPPVLRPIPRPSASWRGPTPLVTAGTAVQTPASRQALSPHHASVEAGVRPPRSSPVASASARGRRVVVLAAAGLAGAAVTALVVFWPPVSTATSAVQMTSSALTAREQPPSFVSEAGPTPPILTHPVKTAAAGDAADGARALPRSLGTDAAVAPSKEVIVTARPAASAPVAPPTPIGAVPPSIGTPTATTGAVAPLDARIREAAGSTLPLPATVPSFVRDVSPLAESRVGGGPMTTDATLPARVSDPRRLPDLPTIARDEGARKSGTSAGDDTATPIAANLAIESVLDRYRGAFDERNAAAARAVWPTADIRGLGRAFEQLEQQRLVFTDCRIALNETQATAECRGSASYVPRVGSKTPRSVPRVWRFELHQRDARWVIGNVTTQ